MHCDDYFRSLGMKSLNNLQEKVGFVQRTAYLNVVSYVSIYFSIDLLIISAYRHFSWEYELLILTKMSECHLMHYFERLWDMVCAFTILTLGRTNIPVLIREVAYYMCW